MSDPALSRPPFIPEGTFRCSSCFDVSPETDAWEGELYGQWARWDTCVPCQKTQEIQMMCYWMAGRLQ